MHRNDARPELCLGLKKKTRKKTDTAVYFISRWCILNLYAVQDAYVFVISAAMLKIVVPVLSNVCR